MKLKVFISTDFQGHWPVGTAAVVVAKNRNEARNLLVAEAKKFSSLDLTNDKFTFKEVDVFNCARQPAKY